MSRCFRSRLRSLRTLVAIAVVGFACARPAPQVIERPAAEPRAGEHAQASARATDALRDLLLEGRVEAANALVKATAEGPGDERWHWLAAMAALADSDAQGLARHRAALSQESGWALLLRAQEQAGKLPRRELAALVKEARARLGDHPDAVWLHAQVLALQRDEDGLSALAALPDLPDSVRDFVHAKRIGQAFFHLSNALPPMRPSLEQVQALVAEAEQTAPSGTLAVAQAAEGWLELQRADAALGLVERALARRPDALTLTVLRARARVAAAREDASVRAAAVGELVALADRHRAEPEALAQLVAGLQQLGATEAAQAIYDDVRRRFPDARAVERWDWELAAVFVAAGTCRTGLARGELPPADELAQARTPVDAFFARPRVRDQFLRSSTAAASLEFLQCEPGAPLQRVEAVARAVLAAPFDAWYAAQAAVLLASRGGDLELARELAELSLALADDRSSGYAQVVMPSEFEEMQRAMRGGAHHARGLVHLRAGRVEDARADISRAHELSPAQPDIALLAAELAERDGEGHRAEQILARSIAQNGAWARACRERLQQLVRARGGNAKELDRTIVRLEREWKDERIAAVLAGRAAAPQPLAPFELDLRGGGRISNEALRGRVTVVIATEPWCLACRFEAPALAKLQQRYRGRKDVQFLVVTSDPDGIAALHGGAGFHPSIARDDGWRTAIGINSYPTHLFIDAAGREVYRESGGSGEMPFTFPALIEALRRGR